MTSLFSGGVLGNHSKLVEGGLLPWFANLEKLTKSSCGTALLAYAIHRIAIRADLFDTAGEPVQLDSGGIQPGYLIGQYDGTTVSSRPVPVLLTN